MPNFFGFQCSIDAKIQHINYDRLCVEPMVCPGYPVLFRCMLSISSKQVLSHFDAEILQQTTTYITEVVRIICTAFCS